MELSKVRTIVVTGAGSGIGFDIVKNLLSQKDAHIVALCQNRTQMETAASKLREYRERLSFFTLDLSQPSQIQETIRKIKATQKNIWGLVNNAGIYPFGNLEKTTRELWDQTFDINLRAAFLMTQGLVPLIKDNSLEGGRLVFISSTAGILPNHFALAYSVSKAAVIQLSRTLAKELGEFAITSNCICPGIVRSPMHEAYHGSEKATEDFYQKRGSSIPLKRVGEPEDVSHAVNFFLSDAASWITGETLNIEGGRLLQ